MLKKRFFLCNTNGVFYRVLPGTAGSSAVAMVDAMDAMVEELPPSVRNISANQMLWVPPISHRGARIDVFF